MEDNAHPSIPCTVEDFKQAYCDFNYEIGFKTNTQAGIANMYKGLVCMYLAVPCENDDDLQKFATMIEVATREALYRGWNLETPVNIGS